MIRDRSVKLARMWHPKGDRNYYAEYAPSCADLGVGTECDIRHIQSSRACSAGPRRTRSCCRPNMLTRLPCVLIDGAATRGLSQQDRSASRLPFRSVTPRVDDLLQAGACQLFRRRLSRASLERSDVGEAAVTDCRGRRLRGIGKNSPSAGLRHRRPPSLVPTASPAT